MHRKIIIGSRESRLAVVQSEQVLKYIKETCPEIEVDILTMKTTGDIILDRRLDQIGGKGLFVKELDKALMTKCSDLSVHSLKDMPMEIPEELPMVAYSKRADVRDVLVYPKGKTTIDFSKPIGCSSLRRILQAQQIFPEARFESIRGNVLTRLEKLDRGEYSALILAAAGLKRLGLEERISRYFSVEEILPAAGQGILAIQGRKGENYRFLEGYNDAEAMYAASAERAFVKELDGGCSSPVAAYGEVDGTQMTLTGLYYQEDTKNYYKMSKSGDVSKAGELGRTLAEEMKDKYMNKGKVWLVGAGPGDMGLLTLKGRWVLENAEVVVYDSLVGSGILSLVPMDCEMIYVGKRAGNHTMVQKEINGLLLQKAKEGYRVVRLKGGDPFLFGRGGEELELLVKNHIPYEIVPGVTSSIAVPAYQGIPVTHRDYCSSVHIITGHKKKDAKESLDYDALARTKGTLVFLMGVAACEDICKNLMAAGMSKDMPAAILEKGTTSRQRRVVSTLEHLFEDTKKAKIKTPAIIVVGEVCALSKDFEWFEKLPLSAYKVVLTRPKHLISKMAEGLRKLGCEVVELPTITIEAIEDSEKIQDAMANLERFQWLVFTSPSGVKIFFELLKKKHMDIRKISGMKVAVIGEGSRKALEERGIFADLMPEIYDGEHLGETLAASVQKGEAVLIPRAAKGNEALVSYLLDAGAIICDLPIYETKQRVHPELAGNIGNFDCAVFTSASTVEGFVAATKDQQLDYTTIKAACIGKQTQKAAMNYGMETFVSKKATLESLSELIIEMSKM